ncbi:MAG: hypothetical protein ABI370_07535 [Gammaproteobacteria bacterium]
METNSIYNSQDIFKRMAAIHNEIEAHRESIELLYDAIDNNKFVAMTPYAPRMVKYSRIGISERRFQCTLRHLNIQIKLLEKELATLIKYMMNEAAA